VRLGIWFDGQHLVARLVTVTERENIATLDVIVPDGD
jgi:hypothetical protein